MTKDERSRQIRTKIADYASILDDYWHEPDLDRKAHLDKMRAFLDELESLGLEHEPEEEDEEDE